ncbi:MAG TPA: hypothetical protein VFW48_09855, partial [Solirubrobacterales bacterium]|nr:hypothetical protein [Solirubrobacterales bacterium]
MSLLSVVAAATTLSIAAAPASASTVLCKNSESPCGETQKYPGGTTLNASLAPETSFKTESSFISISCSGSSLSATTGAEAGSPIEAELTSLTFTGCTSPQATGCSMTGFGLPDGATIAATGGGNGTVTFANFGYEFTCTVFGLKTTCSYTAPNVSFSLSGGNPAALTAGKTFFTRTGK